MTDNVEILARLIDAVQAYWAGGPWEETIAPLYDPEIDYYPVRKFPDSKPCHGLSELRQFYDSYKEAWESFEWKIVDVVAVGDDRVLAHLHMAGAGRGSGVTIAGDLYACYWLRAGRIFRHDDHLTEEGARRALGMG